MELREFLKKYGFIKFTEEHVGIVEKFIDECKRCSGDDEGFRPCGGGAYCDCSECPFDSSNNIYEDSCGDNRGMPLAFIYSTPDQVLEQILLVMNDYKSTQLGFWEI